MFSLMLTVHWNEDDIMTEIHRSKSKWWKRNDKMEKAVCVRSFFHQKHTHITHTHALHTNSSTISSAGTLHFMWCISQFTFNWIQCVHLPFDIWPFWKCHKKNCANGTAGGSFLFCIALIAIQKCIVVEHKAVCASCVHVGYVPREWILFFFPSLCLLCSLKRMQYP